MRQVSHLPRLPARRRHSASGGHCCDDHNAATSHRDHGGRCWGIAVCAAKAMAKAESQVSMKAGQMPWLASVFVWLSQKHGEWAQTELSSAPHPVSPSPLDAILPSPPFFLLQTSGEGNGVVLDLWPRCNWHMLIHQVGTELLPWVLL